MKKYFLLFILFLTVFSCQQEEFKPKEILEKEKMAEVLIDIELLEAVVKQKMLDRKYPKKNVPVYIHQVMEKNKITYQQFQSSFAWWSDHPRELKEIYDDVNKQLEEMKAEYLEETKDSKNDTANKKQVK